MDQSQIGAQKSQVMGPPRPSELAQPRHSRHPAAQDTCAARPAAPAERVMGPRRLPPPPQPPPSHSSSPLIVDPVPVRVVLLLRLVLRLGGFHAHGLPELDCRSWFAASVSLRSAICTVLLLPFLLLAAPSGPPIAVRLVWPPLGVLLREELRRHPVPDEYGWVKAETSSCELTGVRVMWREATKRR